MKNEYVSHFFVSPLPDTSGQQEQILLEWIIIFLYDAKTYAIIFSILLIRPNKQNKRITQIAKKNTKNKICTNQDASTMEKLQLNRT